MDIVLYSSWLPSLDGNQISQLFFQGMFSIDLGFHLEILKIKIFENGSVVTTAVCTTKMFGFTRERERNCGL